MKYWLLISLSVLVHKALLAQNESIVLRSFVKTDTVLLRWAPINSDLLIQGLQNGYQIERIQDQGAFENSPTLYKIQIDPFEMRYNQIMSGNNQALKDQAELIQAYLLNTRADDQSKQLSYAILLLSSSVNRSLAETLGIFYADQPTITGNFTYRVRIQKTNYLSESIHVETSVPSQNYPLTALEGEGSGRFHQAYLKWEAASLEPHYAAYWIERSEDSIHFEKRNKTPLLFLKSADEIGKTHCDFADTSVEKGKTYFYRITGISYFAENGASSNILRVYIPQTIHGEIHIKNITADGKVRTVTGELLQYGARLPVSSYVLLRSDSLQSGYKQIASIQGATSSFKFETESSLETGDRFYYLVGAVSQDRDTLFSFPYYFFTFDQEPPSSPIGLSGSINASGIACLNWTTNPEADIRGYRVYRSNSLKEEFVEITTSFCTHPDFSDTLALNTLTTQVFYRVVAVDLNFNNSPPSLPLQLFKPDTIKPVEAIFTDYVIEQRGITVSWINSSSEDVRANYLLRRSVSGGCDTLVKWVNDQHFFLDSLTQAGESYSYCICTIDQTGNFSRNQELNLTFEPGVRSAIKTFSGQANIEQKQIELTWTVDYSRIYSIQIYRAKNEGDFILYKTLRDEESGFFTDNNLQINNTYRYKIRIMFKDGSSTTLSDEVRIVY